MPISGDLKSWDFFRTSTPPPPDRICQCDPPRKIFSDSDSLSPPPRPPPINFEGKTWIYLSGTSNKKFFFFFCLQRTKCITQENEARNRNTSIRSQMILKFWNKRRLNCNFCGQLIQTSFYPRVLVTRAGERETPGQFWRVGIYVNYPGETGDYIPLFYCAYITLPFVVSSHHNI